MQLVQLELGSKVTLLTALFLDWSDRVSVTLIYCHNKTNFPKLKEPVHTLCIALFLLLRA